MKNLPVTTATSRTPLTHTERFSPHPATDHTARTTTHRPGVPVRGLR